jgi:hypothetical protein
VRKSGDDVFDCCILHIDVFGGPECLCFFRERSVLGPEYQKDATSDVRAIALGVFFKL